PPDRRLEVVPGAVGGDAHVEVTAERRIPKMHRWRPLARCGCGCASERLKTSCFVLPFLRHGFPRPWVPCTALNDAVVSASALIHRRRNAPAETGKATHFKRSRHIRPNRPWSNPGSPALRQGRAT